MTVECCEKCGRADRDTCSRHKECIARRMWFSKQWEEIQKRLGVTTQEK